MMTSTARAGALVLCVAALVSCSDDTVAPPTGSGGGGSGGQGGPSSSSGGGVGGVGGGVALPATFSVAGFVVDAVGMPVDGAYVLQGGDSHQPWFTTGPDGSFSIEMHSDGVGNATLVAGKVGYRTAGLEVFTLPTQPVVLTIFEAGPPDNLGYVYGEPGQGSDPTTAYCGHCHEAFTAEFQQSKHAEATKNSKLQNLYAGVSDAFNVQASCEAAGGSWLSGKVPGSTATTMKCYLGGGVLPDLNATCGGPSQAACDDPTLPPAQQPSSFGACADCHAPGIEGAVGGRDLHDAEGIAFENGVHCDVCHKVKDIDPTQPPGVAGRLILQRPSETFENMIGGKLRPVMFGPLVDVPNPFMGGSYQPKFSQAVFCSGCHLQNQPALLPGDSLDSARWPNGLPVHATYDEWAAGPYAANGVQCQFCHMPEHTDLFNTVDITKPATTGITGGFARPTSQVRSHRFRGPLSGSPRLLDAAINPQLTLNAGATTMTVDVTLTNTGCGHAVPTGEPMRALLMVVEATCDGVPLAAVGGMTINDVGGARGRGVVGVDVQVAGNQLTWAAAAPVAKIGDAVRIVRPSGNHHDYDGVGLFSGSQLTPAEKGMEVHTPVATAQVTQVVADVLTLDGSVTVQAGDVVYLGDVLPSLSDGQPSIALAGIAGYSYAKVLVDSAGKRSVPHYRAVDVVSDNRIPPAKTQTTSHVFAHPGTCASATATVTVLYRPLPLWLATERGWNAQDWIAVVDSASTSI